VKPKPIIDEVFSAEALANAKVKLVGRKVGRPSKIEKHIMNLENKITNEDSEYSDDSPV